VSVIATALGFATVQAMYLGDANNLMGSALIGIRIVNAMGTLTGLCAGSSITIGALNDLSDAAHSLTATGHGILAGEQLAVDDVNTYLQNSNCHVTFTLLSKDYALDPNRALLNMSALKTAGARVVIGPDNSGAAEAVLPFADTNQMVVISPSSTEIALAYRPLGYLFRVAPNDGSQGTATAREVVNLGGLAAIIVYINNAGFGTDIAASTRVNLESDGMPASNIVMVSYDPSTIDFSSTVTQITNAYSSLSGIVGAGHVLIVAVSSEEINMLLSKVDSQNPSLLSLLWLGAGGEALDPVIATTLSADVKLASPWYSYINNSNSMNLLNRISGSAQWASMRAGGLVWALNGYDSVWLAALAVLQGNSNTGPSIQSNILSVANKLLGTTGRLTLSSNGDRLPIMYQIWDVVPSGGGDVWSLAGNWYASGDRVAWISRP
jgi:branched-chain amino acid transport system substrate-binding protein